MLKTLIMTNMNQEGGELVLKKKKKENTFSTIKLCRAVINSKTNFIGHIVAIKYQ